MKLSIIIPVYNTAKYLPDCLNSCLNQRGVKLGEDYEIICVNDGSTDNSLQVLTEFADNQRLSGSADGGGYHIVNQCNEGLSAARNRGFTRAKGDYIWFIDSDDYIEEDILVDFFRFMNEHPADCYVPDYCHVDEYKTRKLFLSNQRSFESISSQQWRNGLSENYVWVHIISKAFLISHDIRFKEGVMYIEDQLWMFWNYFFDCSLCYTNRIVYAYRQRASSIMHCGADRKKRFNTNVAMLETYQEALVKYGDSIAEAKKHMIQERLRWSTQNVLFDAIYFEKRVRMDTLQNLTAKGLYPYPILWSRLSVRRGIRHFCITLISLFLPCRYYYNLLGILCDFTKKLGYLRA